MQINSASLLAAQQQAAVPQQQSAFGRFLKTAGPPSAAEPKAAFEPPDLTRPETAGPALVRMPEAAPGYYQKPGSNLDIRV